MAHLKPSRPLVPNPASYTGHSPPHEVSASERLLAFLDREAPLEGPDGMQRRELVLQELSGQFRAWIRSVAVARGVFADEDAAAAAGGAIFLSGSYKLGVNSPDGDIDAVCVAPQFVDRDEFFGGFAERLRSHAGVTSLLAVTTAKVPIIELVIQGVNIDLQFAKIAANSVPALLNVLDDNILQGLDQRDVTALNGPRVTELIVKLVPDYANFCVLLRATRLWAARRGIYSNKLGYLGGVNFNILCAFVCQSFPNLSPAGLLRSFFMVFVNWPWPRPVKITEAYLLPLGYPVWTPEMFRGHVMPIITPAYPCQNSSVNVTRSTLTIMQLEWMVRGATCAAGCAYRWLASLRALSVAARSLLLPPCALRTPAHPAARPGHRERHPCSGRGGWQPRLGAHFCALRLLPPL
jgi:poly(A) polymerase